MSLRRFELRTSAVSEQRSNLAELQAPNKFQKQILYKGWVYLPVCVIPKLFHKADIFNLMKLNKSKVIETLRKLNEGKTVYQARKVAKISVRRVYQVKEHLIKMERFLR